MKLAKRISIIFFACSALLFAFCIVTNKSGTDRNGPDITMDKDEIEVSITDDKDALLAGVSAKDSKDGDVTDSLVVESISNFIEKGRRKVSIVAFDSDNNITRATRELVYTDYESPKFSLSSPLKFSFSSSDYTEGLSVTDCMDGDISSRIRIKYEEELKYGTPGEYKLIYSVSNSAGDAIQLPVTVEFYNENMNGRPGVELSEYLVYTKVGQTIDPREYVESVSGVGIYTLDEIDFSVIEIENPVDVNTPGVYEVVYRVTDEEENTGVTRLIVIVEE